MSIKVENVNRKKLLFENMLVYGIANALIKALPLFLLPILTKYISSPTVFGIVDMYNLLLGFIIPIAILGLNDALFKEYFVSNDNEDKIQYTSTAFYLVILTALIVSLITYLLKDVVSILFFSSLEYSNIVIIMSISIFFSTLNSILILPIRLENRRVKYIIINIFNLLSYYFLSIQFIRNGFSYYSLIYANLLPIIVLFIFYILTSRKYFKFRNFSREKAKSLLKIGLPLMPTFIIYWLFGSIDRLFIIKFFGAEQLGIYSIGSKFASLSLFIYGTFASGWQHFAFSTMKTIDQKEISSKLFNFMFTFSIISLLALYPFVIFALYNYFPKEYYAANMPIPYLYFSNLLLMLFQILASQILIYKKTYFIFLILLLGSIFNLLSNIIITRLIGLEGAAISTFIGYLSSVVVAYFFTIKNKLIFFNKTILFDFSFLFLYFLVFRFLIDNIFILSFISYLLLIIVLMFHCSDYAILFSSLKLTLKRIKNNYFEH